MATQLKNLKFSDYTIKGEYDGSANSTRFVLGDDDSIGYMETASGGGSAEYHSIIDAAGSGNTAWYFRGVADYSDSIAVETSGVNSFTKLYGKTIPTFSKSGSSATVDELEDWIIAFVNRFSGGSSAYVIAGTYNP